MKRRTVIGAMFATAAAAAVPGGVAAAPRPSASLIRLEGERLALLDGVVARLRRVQRVVGYGHFNLIGFDEALKFARAHSKVGAFERAEVRFLEEMFFADATRYGFFGEKVFADITAQVKKGAVVKIRRSGHYLLRGRSHTYFQTLRSAVGDDLVLTSGVRGVAKQMYLFLAKAVETSGDLSTASRSLAPPGHSFHGIGDFDVGQHGFGRGNFTEDFASTDAYRRLSDLGYVSIRYPASNPFGVRFEPWHIRVV